MVKSKIFSMLGITNTLREQTEVSHYLFPMSEVAGEWPIQKGANYLEKHLVEEELLLVGVLAFYLQRYLILGAEPNCRTQAAMGWLCSACGCLRLNGFQLLQRLRYWLM